MEKKTLRQELRQLSREVLTAPMREAGSRSIVAQLALHPLWIEARRVALYSALPDEPSLEALIKGTSDKELFLPRVLDGETMAFYPFVGSHALEQSGSFGIWEPKREEAEPVDPRSLDLIIIPALAYDASGYRLGRGKGYYDRYLATTPAHRLGVTFGLRRIEALPYDPWDLPVEEVLYPQPALL
nr:5-formyltetrahydrofolate cyclo-ligase [uncultured Porphyromonas sp.]